MKKWIIPFVALTSLFFNCNDEETETAKQWYQYQETQCADAWQTGIGTDEATVMTAVEDYLENLDIEVFDINMNSDGQGEACLACVCLSGRIIRIEANVNDATALQAEGFEVE